MYPDKQPHLGYLRRVDAPRVIVSSQCVWVGVLCVAWAL